ncbi:MAG: GNAT family N-acetyltransferase [Candidatus Hermodarchaeota archaeon]
MKIYKILSNGIIIRNLQESDVKSLIDLVDKVFVDVLVSPTVQRLLKYYPKFSLQDNLIVFDTNKNKIIAFLCLLRGIFILNGIKIPFGQMEIVATDPDYRYRGFIRELNLVYEKLASEYNLPLLIIHGIPYFYRQFNYEFALSSESSLTISLEIIPTLNNNEVEPVIIKKINNINDFENFLSCRAKRNLFLDLYRVVEKEHWEYISHGKLGEVGGMELYLIKKNEKIIGSFYLEIFFNTIQIRELWLKSVHYMPSVLRFVKSIVRDFNIPLGVSRPAQESLIPYLEQITESRFPKPYAYYVRIPSIMNFLILIKPLLEIRLAASEFKELSESITISCYTEGYVLNFKDGQLIDIKELKLIPREESHIRIPPLIIYQLLLGYRTIDELENVYPDVFVNAFYRALTQILFPKVKASITPSL